MPAFTIGTYDIGADNKENLIAAINAANGTNYSLTEFQFNDPVRVLIPQPLYNTSIKLGPLAATGYIGFKTIYYNRVHASEIGPMVITWQNEAFLTELLPRLSQKYGISLTPDDVFEQVIVAPVPPATEVSVTLNFKETSIAYYGGSVIVLGTNDPSIEFETAESLPYKNDLIFFVNNFIPTKNGDSYLESSVLGIASDKVRSRTMNITNVDTAPFVSIVKNTYTNAQRQKLEQYLPFVFSWTVGDSKTVRGINIYGDVIEINETSNFVEKLSSVVTVNPLDGPELANARSKILVREGTQAEDGSIYVLVGDPATSSVLLMKSEDSGTTFTEVTVNKVNRAAFNYADWESVVIHDLVVVGNKLSILVTNPNTYGVHPTKRPNGPAVEEYILNTGSSDYFPINPEFVTNTNFSTVFNASSKLRFVSDHVGQPILDVVAIGRTSVTLEPVILYCTRKDSLEYTAEVLHTRFLDHALFGISAYSKPLIKDPTGKFVSVEILSIVPVASKDDFFLVETNIRGEDYDMGYGVITLSTIRKEDLSAGWSENVLDLGGGSQPTYVTVTDKGKRNHYIFAGGNTISRTKYQESTANVFVPTLEEIFDVGNHPGFDLECDIGNGAYVAPVATENPIFVPIYNEVPDEESLKPPISFSFIVKNKVTGQDMWLTSSGVGIPLTERMFGKEYGHLGTTPVAVFADASANIYAWTKYQGIYRTANQGNSWSDFAAIKNYYDNSKYLGKAFVEFKPEDFIRSSTLNTITYMEMSCERDVSIFKMDTLTPNYNLQLRDRIIYRIDSTKPAGDVIINNAFLTTSANNASAFSPRRVLGWDTDQSNNIRALSKYTEAGVEEIFDQLEIPVSIVEDVFASYSDVGFFDLKAVLLTESIADGFNLYLLDETDTLVRHGLSLSDTPAFPTFEPTGIVPLWDGNDVALSYTPIIITSTGRDVLILERDGLSGGTMTVTIQQLTVPDDNSNPIQWFPMFNSNRGDQYVFQEDNGIFKVVYAWDGAGTVSIITLEKIYSTDTLNVEQVYSGCQFNVPAVIPYGESTIGPWPVYGTVLGDDCLLFDKRQKLADGFGGYFWQVVAVNSEDCGYVVPTPGDTGLGGGNINIG